MKYERKSHLCYVTVAQDHIPHGFCSPFHNSFEEEITKELARLESSGIAILESIDCSDPDIKKIKSVEF
ncbi:hypothetical protein TNCT_457391 [Trichonephila clavata]|uniref:Uncharacterized protein n=1 Tax=Trichonephila clavata TaxID=2740835 RepID=A0A8X6I533_TRICU|nr:hypothetical protein TNCT_457391 [Trichonephila clavata]